MGIYVFFDFCQFSMYFNRDCRFWPSVTYRRLATVTYRTLAAAQKVRRDHTKMKQIQIKCDLGFQVRLVECLKYIKSHGTMKQTQIECDTGFKKYGPYFFRGWNIIIRIPLPILIRIK